MEQSRNLRNTRQGVVVSAGSMDKTVVVKVTYRVKDAKIKEIQSTR